MASLQRLGGASLLGAVCGVRTFTGPAALALRGRVDGTPARVGLTLAAAGEAIGDKLPLVPSRTAPPALAARIVSGALSGSAVAGLPGVAAGAAAAVAGAMGAQRARTGLTELTGLPSAVTGLVEDGAAVAAAALATREPRAPDGEPAADPEPTAARFLLGAARGAVAGVTATAAMTGAQLALQRVTGGSSSRTPEQAIRKVLEAVFGTDVPRRRRDTLNQAAHWAYGTWWGVALGLTAAAAARRPPILAAGPGLGLTAWAAEQVELPALGVAPPPWRQPPGAVATDACLHLLHGVTAAAVLRALP